MSTPQDQSDGVGSALAALGAPAGEIARIVHGTTVVTNLLLERRANEALALVRAALSADMKGAWITAIVPFNTTVLDEEPPSAIRRRRFADVQPREVWHYRWHLTRFWEFVLQLQPRVCIL